MEVGVKRRPTGYVPLYRPRGRGAQPVTVLLSKEAFMALDQQAREYDVPRSTLASRLLAFALEVVEDADKPKGD